MTTSNHRRAFLKQTFLLSAGAAAGGFATLALQGTGPASADDTPNTGAEQRLRELGITLPPPPQPVAVKGPPPPGSSA